MDTSPKLPSPTLDDTRPPAVDVVGLRCLYDDHEAVAGIDLRIERGELFALLGTNGAGKTTALETLEGHRPPDGGRVRVLGQEPHRARRRLAARTGVMFQESGLPDTLTPAETVRLWGRMHGSRQMVGSADELLDRVALGHRTHVKNRQLSGGERRRLDLALALSSNPPLLFLDEPTTGLDPEARRRTWELIREVHAAGTTLVLTTHYLEEAEALADRLAIMHAGTIHIEGTLEEVIGSRPAAIRCHVPASYEGELPPLQGRVAVTPHGDLLSLDVATHSMQDDLATMLDWAQEHRIELHGLRATEASLDQLFHELTDEELV